MSPEVSELRWQGEELFKLGTPIFKTEALQLVRNVQLVESLLLCYKQPIQHQFILLFFGRYIVKLIMNDLLLVVIHIYTYILLRNINVQINKTKNKHIRT